MATLEKLVKAFEGLKVVQLSTPVYDEATRKKEKITHCITIADAMCNSGVKGSHDFSQLISVAIETLLQLCDDQDSNVRMIADESLNRIIRALTDSNVVKIQVELHKEIKKNGNARTLRAALWRFAELCHMIRPVKGKPYVVNLIPCIVQIARRTDEESVLETLAAALQKIFKSLGSFTNDNEVKTLLKAFLQNLSSPSAVARRTAASSILSICLYCRKPLAFLSWVLHCLLEIVEPVLIKGFENGKTSLPMDTGPLLGVLGCLRHILPHLSTSAANNKAAAPGAATEGTASLPCYSQETAHLPRIESIFQVYELSLICAQHEDHNVVNAALETLQQLLRCPPEGLIPLLLDASSSSITKKAVSGTAEDESKNINDKLDPPFRIIQLQNGHKYLQARDGVTHIENCVRFLAASFLLQKNVNGDMQPDKESVGTLASCTIPDATVRVSVKALALGCIANALALDPRLFFIYLEPEMSENADCTLESSKDVQQTSHRQPLSDVLIFATHSDPQLRGLTCILVGSLIWAALIESGGDFQAFSKGTISIDQLVSLLVQGLEDESSLCCRQTLGTLQLCLGSLLESQGSPSAKVLLNAILPLNKNPYWLVKVKLLEVVSELPMVSLSHTLSASSNKIQGKFNWNHQPDFQDQVLHGILLHLLGDEDNRVRHAAAAAFVRIIPHLFFPADYPGQDPATARASYLVSSYLLPVSSGWGPGGSLPLPSPAAHINGPPAPFGGRQQSGSLRRAAHVEDALSRVINLLSQSLLMSTSRYLTHGCCEALSMLSDEYLTTVYPWAWSCIFADKSSKKQGNSKESDIGSSYENAVLSPACGLLSTALTLLTSASVSLDLSAQTWLIRLAGNLFSGMAVYCNHRVDGGAPMETEISHRQSWSVLGDRLLASSADILLGHVAKIIATFAHVLDETAPPHLTSHPISSNPSPSPSPSPASAISSPSSSLSTASVSAPSLPAVAAASLASPIKRRGTVGGIASHTTESSSGSTMPSSLSLDRGRAMSPSKSSLDKEEKLEDKKGIRGSYFSLLTITPHYMKMYDILKSAYVNYKITLDQNASEKFVRLLVVTLETLSQLLEVASLHEIGRGAEELLGQLRSTVSLAPTPTVTCVHQLLKCLFGSNLCAQWEEEQGVLGLGLEHQSGTASLFSTHHTGDGFYSVCFQSACHELAQSLGRPLPFLSDRTSLTSQLPSNAPSLATGVTNPSIIGHRDEGPGWLNSLRRRGERKVSSIFKNFGRSSDKACLASYIRLFEPMVIKALKQYTVTSDVQLQCRVLLLLSQLVQLRVNYCLLDSEQIFIGFVLKQFEFIESGQIPQAEELIPCIFYFLVHLSYEKQHSKAIIGVPKIIQLCDGLMASGQPHVTHCVPALIPVVEDVFVIRGKGLAGGGSSGSSQSADLKELDTQREVLFSMLLRLSEYPQVLDLLAVVVRESRTESEELWRRWSRKAADAVLPLVAWGRVRLEGERDDRVTVYGSGCPQASLHRFLAALAPPVLRPVDPLLRTLFATAQHPSQVTGMDFVPHGQEGEVVGVERWLGMVLGIFLALLSPQQAKEEAVLARLEALGLSFRPSMSTSLGSDDSTPADPLGAALVLTPPSNSPEQMAPEQVMARFIFHVIRVSVKKIHSHVFDPASQRDSSYLQEQFCHFLLYCIHMFESGSYSKVTSAAIELVKSDAPEIKNEGVRGDLSKVFLELTPVCPLISCLWCYILILLDVSDRTLWSQMLGLHEEPSPVNGSAHSPLQTKSLGTSPCLNVEVVKKAGTILFCGYLRGGVRGVMADHAAWLLVGHTEAVVRLSGEPPVKDFIAAVHQNSAASGLLVQALASRCQDLSSPSFAWNLLRCIEGVHPSQSGALLSQLLVPRLLSCPHLALSRRASALACRRAELLLVQHLHQPSPAPPSPPPLSSGDLLVTTTMPTPTVGQLPKEELQMLLDSMQEARLMRKHSRLVSLLNKLGSQCYDLSPIDIEHGRSFNPATVRSITADRSWYLGQVKRRCCESKCSGQEVAQLLSKLEFNDIISIMSCKDFNGSVLEYCLKLGLQLTLQALQGWSSTSYGSSEDLKSSEAGSPLYLASKITLLQSVHRLNGLVPRPHQVFSPVGRSQSQKEERYTLRLGELFSDSEFWDALFQIIPSVTCYLRGLSRLSAVLSLTANQSNEGNEEENNENEEVLKQNKRDLCKVPQESIEDLSKFGILCLEAMHWLINQEGGSCLQPKYIHFALDGAAALLSCSSLSSWLAGDSPGNGNVLSSTWVGSGVSAVTRLIQYLLGGEQYIACPFTVLTSGLTSALEDVETVVGAHSCLQVAALIHWIERTKMKKSAIPKFLATPLRCIIIGLARMPLVNSYALVPPEALKQGWKAEPGGSYGTQLPPLPIEYLQEVEVLEQFVFRVTLLGWISRQQFEEMWVAFLGVLSFSPSEGTSPEETLIMAQANSLAVQSMTALLIQTLLLPIPGNPSVSHFIHQARDTPLEFLNTRTGQKLASIHELLCWRIHDFDLLGNYIQLQDVFHRGNLEKVNNCFRYGHSQVSLEYLWTSTGAFSETDPTEELNSMNNRSENKASHQCIERMQRLSESGLDLPSCLHFLLDIYSQWTNSQSTVPLHIVGESIRSLLSLSDLFTEGMQFSRMLHSCLNLLRIHAPEDQPTCQYLVLGACKAAAVLVTNMSPASPDVEAQERVRSALNFGLKSSFMPTRLASLHGLLYLLQAAFARSQVTSGIVPLGTRDGTLSIGSSKRSTIHSSRGEINMQQLSGKAGEVVRRAVSGGVGIVQPPIGNELQLLLPIAMDYIQKHFGEDVGAYELEPNEDHTLLLWALVFFLLESLEEGREEAVPLFSSHPSSASTLDGREGTSSLPPILRLALSILSQVSSTAVSSPMSYGPFNAFTSFSSKSHPVTHRIYLALMHGLERLVVSGSPMGLKVRRSAASLAGELLKHSSPVVALPALQLLLSCMYMGLNQVHGEWMSLEQKGGAPDTDSPESPNPEYLLHTMEQTSALFDRVKRGYPFEVEVVCGVLPLLLTHFFPPSEILTKVIGEFLSSQQPHPRLLAAVLFQVFESACQQSQLPLLQEWVVLSLSNFTQCSPMGMATWCLACFFISASTNPWLRAIFPHVQSRIGRCEFEDRRLLCIAASDFYHQLTDDNQKQTFLSTFRTAATAHPLSPFSDIVTCLT